MKKAFHLMAKPASYHCNLACDYCFYLPKGETLFREQSHARHMSDTVLRQFIRRYIETSPGDEVTFTWQGGEPTLAGLDFYRRALELQRHYARGKRIVNTLQTNGVLLNDEWVRFLAEHRFLVGVSVDGPQHLYDAMRKTHSGRSVFSSVTEGVARLREAGVEFNLLAVVNEQTARAPLDVYHFLTRELGAKFVQFIPAVEVTPGRETAAERYGEIIGLENDAAATVTPWSVTGEAYGSFLIAIFNEWVRHDVGRVFVQIFDNTLAAWAGQTPSLCVMRPGCGASLVVEQNGDVYSCDHFVSPEHRLGNILTTPPDVLAASRQQRLFSERKTPRSPRCQQCAYRFACQGGCPKHRILSEGKHRQNYLCSGYHAFFSHVSPYMEWMTRQLAQRRPAAGIMQAAPFIAAQQATGR